MDNHNNGQTAPLKQRKPGWRHLLRKRTWTALHIIVGLSMLANTSYFSLADLAPKAAEAATVGLFDQCSNDDGNGYATGDTGCRWTNGNIQANNSLYHEGDSTVQRLWLNGFEPGSTHTVTLQYGTTKQGKHAYDFLTTWDASENWITEADLCQGIDGCATADASENTLAIPSDPNGSGQFQTGTRNFTMRGGELISATIPSLSGSYAADSETSITIEFTVASSGDMCTTSQQGETTCGVALFFGAHIASTDDWFAHNGSTGATSIAGSPYHVALSALDDGPIGNRDNQMQAGAIFQGNVIIEKQTVPNGSSQSFTFNSQTPALAGALTDGGQIVAPLNQGSYSVTEAATTGWTLTSITCDDTDSTGDINTGILSLNVASAETVKCVFTNSQHPSLTVTKVVNNNDGGTAVVGDFDLFVGQGQVTSGQSNTMAIGSYVVSEANGPAGYTGVISGDCDVNGNVSLAYGDAKTCIITNSDVAPTLKLVKNIANNNGGSSTIADWTLTAAGKNGFSYVADQSSFKTVKANEAYTLSETGPLGYQAGSWSCNGGSLVGNQVTLDLDEDVTCQITNTDLAPSLKLVKNVSGGTSQAGDWTMIAAGKNGFSDAGNSVTFHDVMANTAYTLSESGPTGYSAGAWSCNGGTLVGNEVTLPLDEDVTCEITNTRNQGTIELQKVWSGVPGSTTLNIGTTAGASNIDSALVVGNGSTGKTPVDTGMFYMSETGGLNDYTSSALTCYDDANGNSVNDNETPVIVNLNDSVSVSKDQNVVCWYNNTRQQGTIELQKVWSGLAGSTTLNIGTSVGTGNVASKFVIGNDTTGAKTVDTGIYYVSEDLTSLSSYMNALICTDNGTVVAVGPDGSIGVGNNHAVVCVYTNTQKITTIALDKTGPATATPGQTFTYGLTWTVSGNTAATNAIISDPLPANTTFISADNGGTFAAGVVTWNLGTKVPGSTGTVNVSVLVNAALIASTTLTNTGTFDTDQTPPVTDSVPTTVTVPQVLGLSAELDLIKSVDRTSANRGDTLTYTLVVTNDGLGELTNVVVTDNLPDGFVFLATNTATRTWNIGTLAAGESKTLTYKVVVGNKVPAGKHINRAFVTADLFDPIMAEAAVTIKVPQVLGLATTGAGLMDYMTFILGLAIVAIGVMFFLKLRRRGSASA